MADTVHNILVPFDYTEKSGYAVKYAIQLAKIIETDIIMLHIIKDSKNEADQLRKLETEAKQYIDKYGIKIECKIEVGVVSKVIKEVAQTIDAFVVIMKTDPPKGREKFSKSRSIRVMMGSRIPFIVVQESPKRLAIRNIVFPIDFRRENKEKLVWISILSKYYTSVVHLFKPQINDYRVRNNLEFAKRFLEGKKLSYNIVTGTKKGSFADQCIDFSDSINAQLIIIMLNKNISWLQSLFGITEQKFITNKYNIPVMVLNPKAELHKYEGFN